MSSNTFQKKCTSRRLLDIAYCHLLFCGWILFAQVRLRIINPLIGLLIIYLTLVCLGERSWRLQAKTMHIWHPAVQLVFCVNRVVFGAVVILGAFVWGRIGWGLLV
jgi:hypothetical protein